MTFSVRPARGASSHAVPAIPADQGHARTPNRHRPARSSAALGLSRSLARSRVLRPARVVAGLSAVLLMPALVACGSEVAPDGTALAPVPTATHSVAPTVANATDLSKAPVIAPGQGKPPKELVVEDLVVGTGATASSSSTVSVHYVGALWDNGKTFDSSREHGDGQPLIFPLDQVITGFAQGIDGMKVGGRRELVIPPALGYGPQGGSPPLIAADDTLVFVVDLVDVQTSSGGAAGTRP